MARKSEVQEVVPSYVSLVRDRNDIPRNRTVGDRLLGRGNETTSYDSRNQFRRNIQDSVTASCLISWMMNELTFIYQLS